MNKEDRAGIRTRDVRRADITSADPSGEGREGTKLYSHQGGASRGARGIAMYLPRVRRAKAAASHFRSQAHQQAAGIRSGEVLELWTSSDAVRDRPFFKFPPQPRRVLL